MVLVPNEECPACGEHRHDIDVARRFDEPIPMLLSDGDVVTRHSDGSDATAA